MHFHNYFNWYRALYRKLIKLIKEKYYSDRLQKAANKQKECWSIVNNIRNNNNFNLSVSESELCPDRHNGFYCTIAEKLTKDIVSPADPLSYLMSVPTLNSFYFFPTDFDELRKTLLGIKNKNAAGEDGLSFVICK